MQLILTHQGSKYMAKRKPNNRDPQMQLIESEEQDREKSLPGYDILTYPADFTLEVLVGKWQKQEIKIPELERRYVWSKVKASKLVESFLMGLPVPPIFFYLSRDTNELLVVDGHQRLKSLALFFSGKFTDDPNDVFSLTGLDERSPYFDVTYSSLKSNNVKAFNKLNNSVMRSFVVKQIDPDDDTSIFQIFERLNTGGVVLQQQEIRNCIYEGPFNSKLDALNKYSPWRLVFGSQEPERRMRDTELILRFLALYYKKPYYTPMKKFLNDFMKLHKRATEDKLLEFENLFTSTVNAVIAALGEKPFHITTGMNAAVFDSVCVAFAHNLSLFTKPTKKFLRQIGVRYRRLIKNSKYQDVVSIHTTDVEIVLDRIKKASQVLFG
jgi:hypothetical protein